MEEGFKPCPFCAEPIREGATICRYCNRSLSPRVSATVPADSPRVANPSVLSRLWKVFFYLIVICGIGFLLLWGILQHHHRPTAPIETKPAAALKSIPLFSEPVQVEVAAWRTYWVTKDTPQFRFTKISGVTVSGAMQSNRRVILSGVFRASQTFVHGALMSFADYTRAQGGYPPLNVQAYVEQGRPFSVVVKPGLNQLAFFQAPPQSDLSQARSMAGLLAMSVQGLVGAPPAAVSAELRTEYKIFGTPEDATKARAALLKSWGRAGQEWVTSKPQKQPCDGQGGPMYKNQPNGPCWGSEIKLPQ